MKRFFSSINTGGKTSPPNPCPNTFGTKENEKMTEMRITVTKIFKILSFEISTIKISLNKKRWETGTKMTPQFLIPTMACITIVFHNELKENWYIRKLYWFNFQQYSKN
ncbi:hypothetical protein [Candidatus Nitrosopumilus salaria]|uniref:hypothetical protein n=1 Tax=Candidatus Nitrosopumilus salarius TaxID=1170320 RepID=UPI0013155024|nr:hypothetical protein [Candidatus Nitrosopumilus salaria]